MESWFHETIYKRMAEMICEVGSDELSLTIYKNGDFLIRADKEIDSNRYATQKMISRQSIRDSITDIISFIIKGMKYEFKQAITPNTKQGD